jgi:hypothetical protein
MQHEAKAARTVKEDRTDYLTEERYGHTAAHATMALTGTEWGVLTWNTRPRSVGRVTVCASNGPFAFQESISPVEARLIAQALLMAADDAEKAIDAAYVQDEVTA